MIQFYNFPFGENKIRRLHIYLPDDYHRSNERYPVMYFFDGQNLFADQSATYGKSWGLADFMHQWHKNMIIVGIECGHEGNERLSEYSPYDLHSSFFGDISGTGRHTMAWIEHKIKPFIDQTYRTYSFREATAIGGSSMGGLIAIYAAGAYNHVFSKGACISSAIQFCIPQLEHMLQNTAIDADTRVFLSWGTQETDRSTDDIWASSAARANIRIEHLFQQHGAQTHLYPQIGGHHREADWEKQVPLFMDFLWMR